MPYKKPKAFFVVSQWNNDVSWIEDYTDQYVIYDKSNTLEQSEKVIKCPNVGHNLHDIFHFIYNNYENQPESYIMERMLWTIFACCFEENL